MRKSCLFAVGALLLFPVPASAAVKTANADYKASITPVLELAVSQAGQSELKFGDITPSSLGPTTSPEKTIVIEVQSNTGERYQVTQTFAGALENASGQKIDFENLKFRSRSSGNTGNPVASLTPAAGSAQTIFISDNAGTNEIVSVDYELTIPASQAPGDYSSLLTFTVSSL